MTSHAVNGLFLALEGIEGVGKSTHVAFVAEVVRRAGRQVTVTREPGGSPLSEGIRGLLLDNAYRGMCPDAELLLMFAARAEHLAQLIRPALARGEVVVSDRFTDATYAYQGGGRGIAADRIAQLERLVQAQLVPDLVIVLDAPVSVALGRARQRGAADRFEAETMAFFERARQTYLARAADSARYRVVDASRGVAEVQAELGEIVESWLS